MAEKKLLVVIGAKISDFDKAMRQVRKDTKGLVNGMQSISKEMTTVGGAMTTGLTLPIVAAGGAAIKYFGDFEQAMTGSVAIMGNLSDTMRNDMELAAREVAKTTRFSAAEAAEAYYFLASAGMDAVQSMEALPRVAAFAQAGNFDMARATELLADAQSALGLTVDDTAENMENMTRVSDVLVKANMMANASVEQFSEALTNKAGAALRLLGKDVEEGVAVLAVFADQGKKGAAAGEALNIVMRDLQRASIKNREEFEKLNVRVYDADGNMRNMADIISDLENAFAGMSDEQLRSTMMMMGFQDESVANIAALLGTSDAIREYERQARLAGNTTQEVAEKQLDNLWDQLGLLKDRLLDSGIVLGKTLGGTIKDVVIPMVDKLIEKIGKLAEWFANLSPTTQKIIIGFAGILAIIGPVLFVLGSIIGTVAKLIPILTFAGRAIQLITAATKSGMIVQKMAMVLTKAWTVIQGIFNAVMMANPIGLIILAIIALIAIIIVVVKYWDEIVAAMKKAWEWIKDVFAKWWEGFKEFWSGIWDFVKEKLLAAWEWIKEMFMTYHPIGLVITHWETIKQFFTVLWDIVKNIFSNALSAIGNFITDRFNAYVNFMTGIKDKIVGVFVAVKDGILNIWRGIVDGIKGFINRIIDAINGMIGRMNRLQFDVPNWVPIIGGKKWGFNLNTLPHLATGGDIVQAGMAMVGEDGPEIVHLPQGAKVQPLATTQEHHHSGTIRVEGINDEGQLISVKEIIIEELLKEIR